jgi:hypothetical protein
MGFNSVAKGLKQGGLDRLTHYVAALAQMKHVSIRNVDGPLKRELRVDMSGSLGRD